VKRIEGKKLVRNEGARDRVPFIPSHLNLLQPLKVVRIDATNVL